MADNRQVHIDAEHARAGWTPHVARYVLGISLASVVIIFAALVLL
ncbi:hypothetical protein [Sphingomonas sp. LaA6.9]|nr:hypothetical protein [Sphingomonas sp. LaA6.9]